MARFITVDFGYEQRELGNNGKGESERYEAELVGMKEEIGSQYSGARMEREQVEDEIN